MGWFDEQIKMRKQSDDDVFAAAFAGIADSVLGTKLSSAFESGKDRAQSAIDEIFRHYHIKPDELPEDVTDLNEQLEYLMHPHGIARRSVQLKQGWRKDAAGAMLGVRKDDDAIVALIPSGLGGYHFYDDNSGKTIKVNRKNEALFEEEAIVFYKPFPQTKLSIAELVRYILRLLSPSDVLIMSLTVVAATLLGFLATRLNYLLIGMVTQSKQVGLLLGMMTFMLSAALAALLTNTLKGITTVRIQTKLDLALQSATMSRILALPANFFANYSSGELANMASQLPSLCEMLTSTVLSGALTSLFSLAYLTQIQAYAPALMLPSLLVILATAVFGLIVSLKQVGISKRTMELEAKESGMCYAMISGIQKIKLAGAEKRAFSRFAKLYAEHAKLNYSSPAVIKYSVAISLMLSSVGTVVLYYAAVKGGVSVTNYFAFNTAYGMISGAFMSLVGIAITAANISPVLKMAKPIMDSVPEVSAGKKHITKLSGSIELSNVSFKYRPSMPNVIDQLSLRIRPGQYVAIVGATGCGKSTLMRLMLGLETPQRGAIYYDGKDLSSIDLKTLRRKIGVVLQNGKLFPGDIFANITLSAPWLSMDDAWAAAELAGFAEDIRRMPMGMFTMISEGTGGISGGQKQRLMIARAVAPMPKVLMFDEATSALDNLTQKKVSEALDKLKCTRIVIAHRLSTIKQCDRIIYLEQGHIVEDGTYDELIAKNGKFAELVERQRTDL